MKKVDETYLEARLGECQSFHYAQSGNVSKLIRTIIFGIVGTIWLISYKDHIFEIANDYLLVSMCLSFGYMLIDIIHYFVDSCCYRWEYFRFDKQKSSTDFVLNTHEEFMTKISKVSFAMLAFKLLIFLFISFCFICGFITHYNIITLPNPTILICCATAAVVLFLILTLSFLCMETTKTNLSKRVKLAWGNQFVGLPAIFVILVCTAAILLYKGSFSDVKDAIEVTAAIASIALALAMFQLTYKLGSNQQQAQLDAIKLQLFKERYVIFKSIHDFHNTVIVIGNFRDNSTDLYDIVSYRKEVRRTFDIMVNNKNLAHCLFRDIDKPFDAIESAGLILIGVLNDVDPNNSERMRDFYECDIKRFEAVLKGSEIYEIFSRDILIGDIDKK